MIYGLPWWAFVLLAFLGAALLMAGLCYAAASGDRKLERARRDLAGPRERDRLGL